MVDLLTDKSDPGHETLGIFWTGSEWVYEICIVEFYGCNPLPCLEGGPYCLWCLHFKFLCLEEFVKIAEI